MQENLDLVEIAPNANPPVCKIIDYGKYRYEVSKREKAARKKQKIVIIKEIKMRPKIDEHDFQTKRNHIQRFIEKGDKVKVSIMFRGRERSHLEIGRTHLSRLTNEIEQLGAIVEVPPRIDGANMIMLLAPKPKK